MIHYECCFSFVILIPVMSYGDNVFKMLPADLCAPDVFPVRLSDKSPKEYAVYRSPVLFWGLVDLVYDMFRVSPWGVRMCSERGLRMVSSMN